MEAEDHEIMVRVMRDRRRSTALAALFVIAFGVFLVLRQSGHAPLETRALGVFCLLLGAGTAAWAWRGDWTPPDAERTTRQAETRRRLGLALRGSELLMLTLALFGLVFPGQLGEYWREHEFMVTLLCVALVIDVLFRLVRWRAAQVSNADQTGGDA